MSRLSNRLSLSTRIARQALVLLVVVLMQGCAREPAEPIERHAAAYVELATSIGTFRPNEVDVYFGPEALDRRTQKRPANAADLLERARKLAADLAGDAQVTASDRGARLQDRVQHLVSLLEVLTATAPPTLQDETRKLYGFDLPPPFDGAAHIEALDELLPGTGTTIFKLATLQNQLVIPAAKREAVFRRALEECKRRTALHWQLPEGEQLTVELTREVDAAWYRYEGGGRGRLQVNPLAIAHVGRSLDVACHEGYPGHHAQFLLFDRQAPEAALPVEDRIVLLRSPNSVLREGAANYGVALAWPPAERLAFERDVLFPLAGLQPDRAETAARVHRVLTELGDATLPVLQEYRDKVISFNTATFRLEREAMIGSPKSLLEFFDRHGSYVVGYTVARERIAELVDRQSRAAGASAWDVLHEVLTKPHTVAAMLAEPAVPPPASTSSASAPSASAPSSFATSTESGEP